MFISDSIPSSCYDFATQDPLSEVTVMTLTPHFKVVEKTTRNRFNNNFLLKG